MYVMYVEHCGGTRAQSNKPTNAQGAGLGQPTFSPTEHVYVAEQKCQ